MVNIISSSQSVTAKKIQGLLKLRKRREQMQQVVVEGPRIVFDLYRNGSTRKYISRVLIDIDQYEKYSQHFQQLYDMYPTVRKNMNDHAEGTDVAHDNDSSPPDNSHTYDNSGAEVEQMTNDDKTVANDGSGETSTITSNKNQGREYVIFHPTYRDVFKASCTDTVTHQGIVAICDIPHYSADDILNIRKRQQRVALDNGQQPQHCHAMYLVCDAIQDPGNIGTLIRSALACGVTAILILPNACDIWNPKAIRAAMGSTFSIPTIEMKSWDDCYERLLYFGCTRSTIYAATMLDEDTKFDIDETIKLTGRTHDSQQQSSSTTVTKAINKSTAHYDVDWIGASLKQRQNHDDSIDGDDDHNSINEKIAAPTASALIIGSEGNGLTKHIRRAIHHGQIQTVYVPMTTMTNDIDIVNDDVSQLTPMSSSQPVVESLNAAVCGSIILFEYVRQKNMYILEGKQTTQTIGI